MVSSDAIRRYDFARAGDEAKARGLKFVRACLDDLGIRWEPNGEHSFVQGWPASGRDSFCVFPNGTWKDFNPKGALARDQGDLIDLAAVIRNESKVEALKWLYGRLGWGPDVNAKRLSDAELARRDAAIRARREEEARLRAIEDDLEAERLSQYFLRLPYAENTVVQTYYEVRRNVVYGPEGLDHLTHTLRHHADCKYWHDVKAGVFELLPAQVAPFYHKGRIVGLHRTYLKLDGSDKADVGRDDRGRKLPVKKMIGRKGIIPLHRGAGNYSAGEALKRGHQTRLIVAEGIEDAEVGAYYKPDYRAWAAGDKGNLCKIKYPPIASGVLILLDNDGDSEAEQEAAAAKVKAHWLEEAAGRPVEFFRAGFGKDLSDWHNL